MRAPHDKERQDEREDGRKPERTRRVMDGWEGESASASAEREVEGLILRGGDKRESG